MMTEEEQTPSPDVDILKTAGSGDTADILAELDELTGNTNPESSSKTSAESKPKPSPKPSEEEAGSSSNNTPAPSPAPAPAPATSNNTASSNAWSWNTLAEGLTTTLTGATADVEAVMEGENTDLGATKADIQEMESAIASAEQAVSSAMFSAFSSVSETLVGTSAATGTKKKKTKKKGGVPVDDSDLDAFTQGHKEIAKVSADQSTTNDNSGAAKEIEKQGSNEAAAPTEASSASDWTSWTDSLAKDTNKLLTSTLPNLPAPPPLDADGNEIPQPEQQEEDVVVPLPSAADAAEAVEAASSSLWSAFSSVTDTILPSASNDSSTSNTKAGSSNVLLQLYTSKVNQAAEWIEELENEEKSKDPYKHLKQHLKDYLKENPTGTYEGWIQLWTQEQDWGEEDHETSGPAAGDGSTIHPSYYKEESIHRNAWNDQNYVDGIAVGDEDAPRKYVQAQGMSAGKRVSQP